jgi:hypothetical protein
MTLIKTLVALAVSTVAVAATPAAVAAEETSSCGGEDTGFCTTGTFTFQLYFVHSCVGEGGYTGEIQSILQHAGGARVFTCVYDHGTVVTARGEGPRPVPGQPFTQYCDAVGVGPWSCYITRA